MKTARHTRVTSSCSSCVYFRPSSKEGASTGFCRFFRQIKTRADSCKSGYVRAEDPRNRGS